MPKDRSYNVFLLEDGESFSLVTQVFVEIQPSLIVASDALMYLSSTLTKISDPECKPITAAELQHCIMETLKDQLPSLNITCLPFQLESLYPVLLDTYPSCQNETEAGEYYQGVSCRL